MEIKISMPRKSVYNNKARLVADIQYDNTTYPLWLEVDAQYADYLCDDRCDAFVLAVLHLAMVIDYDIFCDGPVSDVLFERIQNEFLPLMRRLNSISTQLKAFVMPIPEGLEQQTGSAVGTGCSCGVDSLHVFANHPDITHVCVWNVRGSLLDVTQEERAQAWVDIVNRAKAFAAETGKELVVVDTNFDGGSIPGLRWDGMTTNGNLFCIFAMQGFWAKYYVASNGVANGAALKLDDKMSSAFYEFYLFPLVSNKRIQILLDGVGLDRLDKIRCLASYEYAYKYLNVCHYITPDGRNCSHSCSKCMYTMFELDALGKLELFEKLFDVQYFQAHKEEYLAEYWRGVIQKNPNALELRRVYNTSSIPLAIRVKACWIIFKKGMKKIMRGGKVRYGTFSSRG